MPATSQPTDQPYGRLITDEQALERLFRAQFSALLVDARAHLPGAEMAAPRVVSKAFHMAWNDRAQFKTTEELTAYLKNSIQHGAARELSRRAGLHRADHAISGSTDGGEHAVTHHDVSEMSVDEAWDRLQHTLHGGAPEAYRKRASSARHEAAEHMAALGKTRSWKPIAGMIAAVVVAVAALTWFMNRQGQDREISQALAAADARKYETSFGQQANVSLDDGTTVTLGPDSRLTVPVQFNQGIRAVKIEGTAHFTVPASEAEPFQVRAGDAAIAVTGTVFTVRRFPADTQVVVHVREGSIQLRQSEERREVGTGMSYLVTNGGSMRVPTTEELNEASAWVDGKIVLAGRSLREVLPELRRWFGLNIHVADEELLAREVFVSAPITSDAQAIASVEQSGKLTFTYVGNNMTFMDAVQTRSAGSRRD